MTDTIDKLIDELGAGWRYIESAPRDGTKVILYNEIYEELPIGYWDLVEGCDENGNGGFCLWHVSEFFSANHDGLLWPEEDILPTHWMHLPKPLKGLDT